MNNDPICGNCGNPYSKHYFEREIFCNQITTGDVYTDEPSETWVQQEMAERFPKLYDEIVAQWKKENGHNPGFTEPESVQGGTK